MTKKDRQLYDKLRYLRKKENKLLIHSEWVKANPIKAKEILEKEAIRQSKLLNHKWALSDKRPKKAKMLQMGQAVNVYAKTIE